MTSTSKTHSLPLGDLLPRFPSLQIFASLTRDVSTVSALLSSSTKGQKSYYILLAPNNSALRSLSHKPWETASDYKELGTEAYSGKQGEQRANDNLRKFVERHVVVLKDGASSWEAGESGKVQTAGDTQIWWEKSGEAKLLKPDGIKVQQVLEKGANGEVWEIDGVLGAS